MKQNLDELIQIGANKALKVVTLRFLPPDNIVLFTPDNARALAHLLVAHADAIDGEVHEWTQTIRGEREI